MNHSNMRIVSLLPSTTEIVAALGFADQLVGRSHECDYPSGIEALPACTEPKFNPDGQSYEINQRVKALLQEGLSVYRVDGKTLAELQPNLIITQDHCEVCAASVEEVKEATRVMLSDNVEIISISPTNLEEVYNSIRQIAEALGAVSTGEELVRSMQNNFESITEITNSFETKSLLCIEWLDPLMTAGNWVPELASMANAETLGTKAGTHSPWVEWEDLQELDPYTICTMPCGYSIKQTLKEMEILINKPGWCDLAAVQNEQVFIADGHHYFNRPGPRLVDSGQILAEILHSSIDKSLYGKGWINFYKETKPEPE